MLDIKHLTELSAALQISTQNKDIDEILRLCAENDGFIYSLKPSSKDPETNQAIKEFILVHQSATQLIRDLHQEMQKQLFQSTKTRKGVSHYKGVKHAE